MEVQNFSTILELFSTKVVDPGLTLMSILSALFFCVWTFTILHKL